jgi:hypothetical protein
MQQLSASTRPHASPIDVCSRRRRRRVAATAVNNGGEKKNKSVLVEIARYFTKPLKCETCFGYDRVICDVCRGRGTNAFFFLEEEEEEEETTKEESSFCEKCDGRGYVGCDACNRTGLKNGWLWKVEGGWGSRGE